MANLMKWAMKTLRRAPSPPICFPTGGFETVRPSEVLEERFVKLKQEKHYPTNIGDVLHAKYQIIGRLGFGTTSTVWLARDLSKCGQIHLLKPSTDPLTQPEAINM